MTVSEIVDSIAEVGVLVVIAALFLYIAIRLANMGLNWLQNRIGSKKHDQLLDLRQQVSLEIQDLLDDFLEDHEGSRVMVMEFSNSVTSVAYLPFKYLTCTYEVYELGRPAKAHKFDRMSTSLFTKFFNAMMDSPYIIFNDEPKPQDLGGSILDVIREIEEHHFMCSMLTSLKGKHIGFICMTKDVEFEEDDVDGIQALSSQISALLGVADK